MHSKILFALCFISVVVGQPSFTTHNVITNADCAASVYGEDVDGDGDNDLLAAVFCDGEIVWYENNGSQSFTERTISTSASQAKDVYAIDLDRDGDMDVLSASQGNNKIAWYENNGSQSFTERTITTSLNDAKSLYAIDLDIDGDIDVLAHTGNTNSGQKYLFLTGDAYGWFYKVEDSGSAGYMHQGDVDSAFQVAVSFTYISG